MRAVHLGVMELKGNGEGCFQPTLTIAAPGQEGAVEDATVLVGDAVEFRASHCRCADDGSLIV